MTFYLYLGDPACFDKLPPTHIYRQISHVEFRNFARYLDSLKNNGKLTTSEIGPDRAILARILGASGINVTTSCDHLQISTEEQFALLEANDYGLVCHAKYDEGFSYENATDALFKDVVETGIFEPINSDKTEHVRLRSLAQEVCSLDRRIHFARSLIHAEAGQSEILDDVRKEIIENLLMEYDQERTRILQDKSLSNIAKIKQAIDKYQAGATRFERKIAEMKVRMAIEVGVKDNSTSIEKLEKDIQLQEEQLGICIGGLEDLRTLIAPSLEGKIVGENSDP